MMKSTFRLWLIGAMPYGLRKSLRQFVRNRRNKRKPTLEEQIQELREIITYNHPIDRVPQATGKLRLMQEGNAVLLDLFSRKCAEHGLQYWMNYGTLLGAVRHKGFIPWDDDLDVGMMIEDYNRLRELLPTLFPKEEGFVCSKNIFIQIGIEGTPLNLDIFPYYRHTQPASPENRTELLHRLDKVKRTIVFSAGISNTNDEELLTKLNCDVFENQPPLPLEENPLIFIAPTVEFVKECLFCAEDIFPIKDMEFEGMPLSAPHHSRRYLEILYGDYMTYPPKVGFWHAHVGDMVKKMKFESIVNRFIDRYGR